MGIRSKIVSSLRRSLEPRRYAVKRSEFLDASGWNARVGVDCHPGQRTPRTQLEKGACAALHAASEAIGPLDSMRYLRRQLVEPGLHIDHRRAVDSAQQIGALMSGGKYDVAPKAQMTQEETLATSIF